MSGPTAKIGDVRGSRSFVVGLAAMLIGCSPGSPSFVMAALSSDKHPYECVPLGWVPAVTTGGGYFDAYDADVDETDWWLPPKWSAMVATDRPIHGDERVTFDLLNALAQAGMVQATRTRDGFVYHLTWQALQYYYDGDSFGNNPEHYPYLCYSEVVPLRVNWVAPIHDEHVAGSSDEVEAFSADVRWSTRIDGGWGAGEVIHAHSVTLAPEQGDVLVTFHEDAGAWDVAVRRTSPLPHISLVEPSAWR